MTSQDFQQDDLQPLGGLPATERVVLGRAQIELALLEVRYSARQDSVSAEDGLQLRNLLGEAGVVLPQLQPAQQHQVALNIMPAGPTSEIEVRGRGWQLTSADGSLVVTVMPDAVAVQTTQYERWSASLLPQIRALLQAVEKVLQPELIHRVGLRYVNRLVDEDAGGPQAWQGRVRPSVLGAITDPVFGPRLVTTQQQLELNLGDAAGALVRHGAFKDAAARGACSYLIDTDVFSAQSQRFDVDQTLTTARVLNITALSLFQQIVTPEYREQMQPMRSASAAEVAGERTAMSGGGAQ